ncbi:hypothetical protein [Roseimicrobium sp. ORNL1]|uniref:hypothetical protein n=1 Tax=Roseimicrobium sp. ORNL1 TaxID=2711231 RepID=UPI0019815AC0|nr:hypothetical protein [Roseimicrobium sp. ORNL1]
MITAADIRVLPFCATMSTKKLDPETPGIFNELSVTKRDGFSIQGRKRNDSGRIDGEVIYHLGKLALVPAGDRTGKLSVEVPSKTNVTSYYAVLELADSLVSSQLKLEVGKKYTWSVASKDGQTLLRVMNGNVQVGEVHTDTDKLVGFGFAASVRWEKNEADIHVTFE